MKIENPFIEARQKLIISLDKLNREVSTAKDKSSKEKALAKFERLQKKFFEVDEKSKEFTQKILRNCYSEMHSKEDALADVKTLKSKYPSINKQLEAIRKLHKEAKELTETIKDYKYVLYDELKNLKLKKKITEDIQGKLNEYTN